MTPGNVTCRSPPFRPQAQQQAAIAAQLGGGALVERCQALQGDLLTCQAALLDGEAAALEKDKQLAEMAAR